MIKMVVLCAGCDCPILDKFLLNVLDRTWHADCVQCHDCKATLTEKCFSRDGKLYCRQDFHRRFGTKCGGCSQDILPTELVRRARDRVYHLKCFTCLACGKQLSTGEELYMLDESRFLCKEDYLAKFRPSFGDPDHPHHHHHHQLPHNTSQLLQQHSEHLLNVLNNNTNTNNHNNNNNSNNNNTNNNSSHSNEDMVYSDKEEESPAEDIVDDDDDDDSDHGDGGHHQTRDARHGSDSFHGRNNHSGVQIKQEDSSMLLSNIHNNDSLDSLNSVDGGGAGSGSGGIGLGDIGGSGSARGSLSSNGGSGGVGVGSLGGGILQQTVSQKGGSTDGVASKEAAGVDNGSSGAGKRRGPRTTIKAKQLETLKAAFAATPKPTRHIREQLAQETGLNMRVIQVWFQNRRSKERRMKQLSAMGVRRPFYRNPRRLRGLRPGEELVDEMGQAGFNYFVENGDFYPAYAGYHDYFNPGHHPHPDDIINYLPTSAPQGHMLDPVSAGAQLALHDAAFLGGPPPGELGGMLPPRNLSPPSPDTHAMLHHHHHHHHQHDNNNNNNSSPANTPFPTHLQQPPPPPQAHHLHQALVPPLQHSSFARYTPGPLRASQPTPGTPSSSQQSLQLQQPAQQQAQQQSQGPNEIPSEIW